MSLTQLQARRGLAAAMPGRYTLDGAPRVHIALCGSGDGLQAACFEVARQGYGLEMQVPLISILRTGSGDFSPGSLARLQSSGIAEVTITDVMTSAADGLDRSISGLMEEAPPLLAEHTARVLRERLHLDEGAIAALAAAGVIALRSDPRP